MRTVGMGTEKGDKTPETALKKENKELKKSIKALTAENEALKTELDALSGAANDEVAPVQPDEAK